MAIEQHIKTTESGSIIYSGPEGVSAYRVLALRDAMAMELKHKICQRANPWTIAEDELGITGTKEEVFNEIDRTISESRVQELVDKMVAYQKERQANPPPPRVNRGSGKSNRVVHTVGGVLPIEVEMVCNLLCSAFEAGSSYWCARCTGEYVRPSDDNMIPAEWKDYPSYSWCFGDGKVVCCDVEEYLENDRDASECEKWILDEAAIKRGLDVMAKDFNKHFMDAVRENDDSDTGDIFLQCCLFGKQVYG